MKKCITALSLVLCLASMNVSVYASEVVPYAVTKPTAFAPTSWYNTWHDWSAKYYTYSRYYFAKNSSAVITCEKEFSVEFYSTDGDLIYEEVAGWNVEWDSYYVHTGFPDKDYYFVIYNESDSTITTSDASYIVWE